MSVVNYAVEIYTSTSLTWWEYGIVDGVFRFITGRPGLDGTAHAGIHGPNEIDINGVDVSNQWMPVRWFENFLLKEFCTTSPSRSIDITSCGSYSTDTQFSFQIKNDDKFWKFISDNTVNLTGCRVVLYVSIDGIFYQVSRGRITNNPYTETDYTFDVDDDATLIHKTIPPKSVTIEKYPAVLDALGNTTSPVETENVVVPVVFGNVPYTKIVKTQGTNNFIPLNVINGKTSPLAAASNYHVIDPAKGTFRLELITSGYFFEADELKGLYVSVATGSGANTDLMYKITSSLQSLNPDPSHSGYSMTEIYMETPLLNSDGETLTAAWTSGSAYSVKVTGQRTPVTTYSTTWWFKISSFEIKTEVSNYSTTLFLINGKVPVWGWDSDTKKYINLGGSVSTTDGSSIKLISNSASTSGEVVRFETIDIPMVEFGLQDIKDPNTGPINIIESYGDPSDIVLMTDSSRLTSKTMHTNASGFGGTRVGSIYAKYTPTSLPTAYDAYYFCVDFDLLNRDPAKEWRINWVQWITTDIYGLCETRSQPVEPFYPNLFGLPDQPNGNKANCCPNEALAELGTDTTCIFGVQASTNTLKAWKHYFKIVTSPHDPLTSPQVGSIMLRMGFDNGFTPSSHVTQLKIKEITVVGERSISTVSEDVYTRTYGENTGANFSNSVYYTFKHILEDYDGIPSSLIDYGNLYDYRYDWNVGRTLTEQRNSVDYLNELASQSFVGMFTTRTGKRGLRAFTNFDEPTVSTGTGKSPYHNMSLIIRDSIDNFQKTDISQLYNSFNIKYQQDPGTNEFLKSLNVSKLGRTSGGALEVFPGVTDVDANGNLLWPQYFSGLDQYAESKILWDKCQYSYTVNSALKQAQNDTSELLWYVDAKDFDYGTPGWGSGLLSSAYFFLKLLIQWSTLQKYSVSYSIPLTPNTIDTELLDVIEFTDTFYTNSLAHHGWITSVEVDPASSQINLTALLWPADILGDDLIIEGDHQANTIVEGDHQADTIVETGV